MAAYIEDTLDHFSPTEERINVITHGIGLVLSLLGLVMLISRAGVEENPWYLVSFSIYGISLMLLYAASTFYHRSKVSSVRKKLRVLDHASIYVLIAGTYTPYTLITLHQSKGWLIFGICWGIALVGIIFKLFFTGRWDLVSTIIYVLMGWLIIFDIGTLYHTLPFNGFLWLIAGGFFYTLGAALYYFDKISYNHAIFHFMVLFGSICHFVSVYLYV